MNKMKQTLQEIANSDAPYAEAVSAVLRDVTPQIESLPLSQTVKDLLGANGLPSRVPTNIDELMNLCEALARSLTIYKNSDDNEDVPDLMGISDMYRVRYQDLTNDELLDLNNVSVFERMSAIERQAAASVLIDISVDRGLRCPDLWQSIVTNMGGI